MPHARAAVAAAESALSELDGERGALWIRGQPVAALAAERSFEEVVGLLWTGRLPDGREARCLRRGLGAARVHAFEELWRSSAALDAEHPVDALQGALACLPASERPAGTSLEGKLRILATLAVDAAAWWRGRTQQPLVAPDPSLPHALDWLRMLGVGPRRGARAGALDAWMVSLAEHGTNATSTFAARVVASTGADEVSVVLAGLGALKGPLHGGTSNRALAMLQGIGPGGKARAWLERELDAGRRIPGFGHAAYRTRDPRAGALEVALEQLGAAGVAPRHLALARAVEGEMARLLARRRPANPIAANVDLYGAVLLDAVGLPPELFTPAFAASRAAGWLAHAVEQRATGSLLRPGPRPVGRARRPRAPAR